MPRKDHRLPDVLSPSHLQALLGAVRDRPRDWALVLLLLDTGLRRAEACALRIGDLELDDGMLLVRAGKGRKDRLVPIGRVACHALRGYLANRREGHVFLTCTGTPLTGSGLREILRRAGRRAGLVQSVHPHLLRHTCATSYLRNGGDTFTLQRILGHSDPRVTEQYVLLSGSLLKERHRRASPADHAVGRIVQGRLWCATY